MPYEPYNGGQWMPNVTNPMPQPSNNLWVGNNYSGYSPNRSAINQPQPPAMQYPSQTINNVISVMGPESADAFKMGPNSKVILMDTSEPVFYLKCSDDSGFAKKRKFRYYEESDQPQLPVDNPQVMQTPSQGQPEPSLYLTKEEFTDFKSDFKKELSEFKSMIEDLVMKNG